MYAALRREQIKKFERCLTEGVWKIITTITLNPTSGQYRISDLKYKIGFVFKTIVSPCDSVSNALFLSLAKFDVILSGSANANIFDTRLACTLWGKYAEIGDQACQQLTDGIVVCLIRFAKINLYNDNRSVSNSFDVSQVFVDSTLDELGLFKQSIPIDGLTLESSGSFHKRLYAPRTGDDDGDYPRQIIKEVLTATYIGRGTIFVVVLTTRRLSKRKLSNFKMSRYLKSQDFGVTYAMVLQNLLLPSFGYISILWNKLGKLDACYSIVMQWIFLALLPLNCLMVHLMRVYTGNIADEIIQEDSDAYVDPSSIVSIDQVPLCSLMVLIFLMWICHQPLFHHQNEKI
uniref:Putative replication protein A1 n=1 Tax=Arabidopsis thaliana TaxID=3702 RepID=Q9SK24_ARATH|nr:putative replication protein A1 [Arabidopsis thaliana]